MSTVPKDLQQLLKSDYEHGFVTAIEADTLPPGLNEAVIREISARKREPAWMLDWRLKAYHHWQGMNEPNWAHFETPRVDYQAISYYSAPKKSGDGPQSLDEVDPQLLETYNKLGIPLEEQAVREYPELVQQYLGKVVPHTDNFFAALNAAVFSDGTFVYIPEGVRCPMELSTYFRINEAKTGQFERTLIIADKASSVSYLEGCTAPMRDENQLHAAVVELIALDDASIKYSTVQNWYPGDNEGRGGIYNFVTKRGECRGERSHISWTQVETGSAITWKYPSCILRGNDSVGEFYSIAVTRGKQRADTGTKMIHLGNNTRSTIVSKGISAGQGQNIYRGLVRMTPRAQNARNHTQCDSLLLGDSCGAHTFPYIEVRQPSADVEHEATTSKISEDQLFYCRQRGLSEEQAVNMIVNGFCKEVLRTLPMEFAVEA
ncbi:MAG: Fe-S cluster assembly protein SufB, partial [Gammaproteobacteria bacterium]